MRFIHVLLLFGDSGVFPPPQHRVAEDGQQPNLQIQYMRKMKNHQNSTRQRNKQKSMHPNMAQKMKLSFGPSEKPCSEYQSGGELHFHDYVQGAKECSFWYMNQTSFHIGRVVSQINIPPPQIASHPPCEDCTAWSSCSPSSCCKASIRFSSCGGPMKNMVRSQEDVPCHGVMAKRCQSSPGRVFLSSSVS